MGNFYTNYTLRGPSQRSVAAALAGRAAFVTPEQDGCVVVFDKESDEQNQEIIAELAARLSHQFQCPLLAVLNHDDDLLCYQLFLNGELIDEYNSTPGYFDDQDEDNSESEGDELRRPEGGDAATICKAFGVRAITKVQKILRASSFDENGYAFAVERHADLAGTLGLPNFAAGTGYDQIAAGDLPEDGLEGDALNAKDMVVSVREDAGPHPIPGYYKISFRAHPKLTKSEPIGWLPARWEDLECSESVLSDRCKVTIAPHRRQLEELGYVEQQFKKSSRLLNPIAREVVGIDYLDGTRSHFVQLMYHRVLQPGAPAEQERVRVAFTSVFQGETVTFTNIPDPLGLELPPHRTVVGIKSTDLSHVHQQFIQHLTQRPDCPHQFADRASLRSWFDANAWEIFELRVRRRCWVRMSDYEVTVARRKLLGRGQV